MPTAEQNSKVRGWRRCPTGRSVCVSGSRAARLLLPPPLPQKSHPDQTNCLGFPEQGRCFRRTDGTPSPSRSLQAGSQTSRHAPYHSTSGSVIGGLVSGFLFTRCVRSPGRQGEHSSAGVPTGQSLLHVSILLRSGHTRTCTQSGFVFTLLGPGLEPQPAMSSLAHNHEAMGLACKWMIPGFPFQRWVSRAGVCKKT